MSGEDERIVHIDGADLWCATRVTGPAGDRRTHSGGAGRRMPSGGSDTPHAVLLYSGGPGCPDYLRPVADLLPPGLLAIRFDPRGCGRSTAGEDPPRSASTEPSAGTVEAPTSNAPPEPVAHRFSVDQAIRDLEAIRIAFGVQAWTLCGHSVGADLALLYALRHREHVHRVICLAGGRASEPREWYRAYRARRERGEEAVPPFDFPVNLRVKAGLTDDWRRTLQHPDLLSQLATLDVPAHFIYPEGDIRPSWPVEQVASLLPRGEFRLLSGCDHFMWRDNSQGLSAELHRVLGSDAAECSR